MKKTSFVRKLCAAVLSGLIVIGSLPVAMAADDTSPAGSDTSAESAATPDEAAPADSSGERVGSGENPYVKVNDGAVSYYDEASKKFVYDGKTLSTMELHYSHGNEEQKQAIKEKIMAHDSDYLYTNMYKDGKFLTSLDKAEYSYDTENDEMVVLYYFDEIGSLGDLPDGDYRLDISFLADPVEVVFEVICSCNFRILTNAPVISDVTYNGNEDTEWTNQNVRIEANISNGPDGNFDVDVDGETISGSNDIYSYTATQSGVYTFTAKDKFDHVSTYETKSILIDKDAPAISSARFLDKDGNEVTTWVNDFITVQFDVTDDNSGIDADSIAVSGVAAEKLSFENTDNGYTVSFNISDAKDLKNYTASCADKAGNTAEKTIEAKDLPFDNQAPKAEDFTLTFTSAQSAGDKVLNFLTFGLYSNSDINVKVDVKDDKSGVDTGSIALKANGESLENKGDGVFTLSVPEDKEEKAEKFDLVVSAKDKAGNESGELSVTDSDVRTKLPDGTVDSLKNYAPDFFEIVISKLAPTFAGDDVSYLFDLKTEKDGTVYVNGDGEISATVQENYAGVKSIKAKVDGKDAEVKLADEDTDKKISENTASVELKDLEEGEHTIAFTAVSNSDVSETLEKTFKVDKTAPAKDGDFTYSNFNEKTGKQDWVNNKVNISFKLKDTVDIASVQYYNSTKITEPKDEDLTTVEPKDGEYAFNAEEYGEYTIIAKDALANKSEFKTETVLIDKTAPELDGEFEFSKDWTKEPVDVTFKVKDLPENGSGIDYVTVDGEKIAKVSDTENTYTFQAKHYGKFDVVITDVAGNDSITYQTDTVNFDDIAPAIRTVSFSAAKNAKEFGIYNNKALSVKVTAENVKNGAGDGSAFKAFKVSDGDTEIKSEYTDEGNNLYSITFELTAETKLQNLRFYAEDEAGNKAENLISDDTVGVTVDSVALQNSELKEIVITKQKPGIEEFKVEFDKEALASDGNTVYSGSGVFTTKIEDELSGIDSYTTYFVEASKVKYDSNRNITNLTKLEAKETVEDVSENAKVTSVDVTVATPEKSELKSGKYTAIVAAYNLSGNRLVKYVSVTVDNTAPTITEVRVKTNGQSDTIGKNGIYTSEPIDVEIVWDEGAFSAGIEKVELFNKSRKLGTDAAGKFRIENSGIYHLFGLVTDVFGQAPEATEDLADKKLIVNGTELKHDKNVFEIVVSSSPDETVSTGFDYKFYYNTPSNIHKPNSAEDGTISTTLKNEKNGLKETSAKVINLATHQEESVKVVKSDEKSDIYKMISEKLTVDVSALDTGAYEIVFSATDLSGVTNDSFRDTFYIDKKAPVIDSITYEKTSAAADKLLNLLSFGLYSNENIRVNVKVSDEAPSSGIKPENITLTSESGLQIAKAGFKEVTPASPTAKGEYIKSFTLAVSDENEGSFYSDLSASVKDNFDNDGSKGSFRKFTNYANETQFTPDDKFEIVSSTVAPAISNVSVTGDNQYPAGETTNPWFSKGPELSFSVDDTTSKIHAIKVTLNGEDVTNLCTYEANDGYKGNLPAEFTNFSAGLTDKRFSIPINHVDVKLNTTASPKLVEGQNTLVIQAMGNNNVKTDDAAYTYTFHTDYTAPVITAGSVKYQYDADKKWVNEYATVTFTANDGSGVGLDILEIFRDGVKVDRESCEASINTETGACSFVAKEYGKYSARLTDLNKNSETYDLGAILIDQTDPVVSKVEFRMASEGKNKTDRSYGVYSNTDLIMTVFVDNVTTYAACSPLADDAVEVTNENFGSGEKDPAISAASRIEGTDNYEFTITCADNITEKTIKDMLMSVTDTAGNNKKFKLGKDMQIIVKQDGMDQKLFEVIASTATAQIDDIDVTFGQLIGGVYNGEKGTVKTSVTDALIGLDNIKVYFGKYKGTYNETLDLSKVDFEEFTGKAFDAFDPVAAKVTKTIPVTFDTKWFQPEGALESGRYVFKVTAVNNAGNEVTKVKDFLVDNLKPVIDSVEVTGDAQTIETNGVYLNTDSKAATFVVTVSDSAGIVPSSGIKSVAVKGKKATSINESGNPEDLSDYEDYTEHVVTKSGDRSTASFTLPAKTRLTDLVFTVTDVFGQDVSVKMVEGTYLINGETQTPDTNSYEVVTNDKTNKETSIDELTYKFDYDREYDRRVFKDKDGGKGDVLSVLKNSFAGIKSVEVFLDGIKADERFTLDNTTDSFNKIIKSGITIDAKGFVTGKHDVVIKVTDKTGIVKSTTVENGTFYIDKTDPVVDRVEIDDAEATAFEKVLNILTFGLYSNHNLKVTVSISDQGPSAGIDNGAVVLKSATGKSITPGTLQETTGSETYGKRTYEKVFTLAKGEDEQHSEQSFYNDITVKLNDIYDNGVDDYNQTPASAYANSKQIPLNGEFDIVTTTLAAKIENVTLTERAGQYSYPEGAGTSGRYFSAEPELNFTVTDKTAKLSRIWVYVNDVNVSDNCVYTDGSGSVLTSNGVITDLANGTGSKVEFVKVFLDTANVTAKAGIHEGTNHVRIVTKNNSTNTSDDAIDFIIDTTNPYITAFEFTGQGGNSYDPEDINDSDRGVVKTDYGYFFQNTSTVTVTASDGDGSGVAKIVLEKQDVDSSDWVEVAPDADRVVDNKTAFTIPADFKGNLRAYAIDNVNNNSDGGQWYTPDNAVVETESTFLANTKVQFTLPDTPFRDNKSQHLYSAPTTVTIDVESLYAGIKDVSFEVVTPFETEQRPGDHISIMNGSFTDGSADSYSNYVDKYGKTTNLVTRLTKTIAISQNRNDIDINVTVMDQTNHVHTYKMNEEMGQRFSIDTTAPHIDVEFVKPEGNKMENGDFYKEDRTATITVTERNFNPDDFKLTITNTDGSIPSLVPGENWNTSYSIEVSDPDSIKHVATVVFHNDGDYNMESAFADLAGNEATNNHKKETEFTIDQTAPKISVSYDVNNASSYYNVTRTATITIEEHNFTTDSAYLVIKQDARGADNTTSVTPPSVNGWTSSGDTHRATITFADDGMYSFTVDFKDKATNEAQQAKESTFYIDKKIDTLEILNVKEFAAYDGEVAPLIHYFDNNFASGTYSLKQINFGSDPKAVTNLAVGESAGGGYSKIVAYSDFEHIVRNDGIYQLDAKIEDKAGNTKSESKVFSVNRFGSNFLINDISTKELVEEKFYTNTEPEIIVTEINVNALKDTEIQVNRDDTSKKLTSGTDFEVTQSSGGNESWYAYDYKIHKKNFESEGNYVITISSTDRFDKVVSNRTAYKEDSDKEGAVDYSCPVSFVVDKTAPIVTISGLEPEYYEESSRDLTINCDDAHITSEFLKVEFDGQEITDFTKTETSGNIEIKMQLEADNGDIDRNFKVTVSDKAGNFNNPQDGGEVNGFRLSTSWISRLLHYNLPLVIAAGVVLAAGIGLLIFLLAKKRKKTQE